ncbi:mandelate racemase/muconate lactonizing enzyme family protein [Nesterenkonia alba]|uniref:mandelate racemase/muconate lactonizing enzyme family protein n=1 Tax=Nesterenkonia alba TaxID=515814 RepID=UPI0003B41328|nr:mandelate racemase/muconate lactonizing enzyme family protein [Nesterenkonia alba]
MTTPPVSSPSPVPSIARIELLLTTMPFSAARRVIGEESIDEYNASSHTFTQMQALMVKITDADGVVGWGEAFGHKTNPASWAAAEEIVGPFFLGKPAEPAAVRAEAEYAFHAFGRTGPVHFALSAVDTALWDLAAQRAGVPLRKLISPEAADTIDCYASLVHYGEDPVEVAHHISRAQDAGYRAFKLHESTPAAIAAAREQAGPQADLMTDVNCAWDEAGAAQALRDFAAADLLWLEEPVFPPDDTAALARLNSEYGKISAGENASGVYGLIEQMRAGALAFAQPSVGKIGGISGMLDVVAAGKAHAVTVVPHCFYYGPALNASAHLCAAIPGARLEVPFLQWPQQLHALHGAGPQITLDETPGLGFTPDEQVLSDHLVRSVTLG